MRRLIKTTGEVVDLRRVPTVEEVQKMVGGYVVAVTVPVTDDQGETSWHLLLVNEDGLSMNLSENRFATELVRQPVVGAMPGEIIVGDAVIIEEDDWV